MNSTLLLRRIRADLLEKELDKKKLLLVVILCVGAVYLDIGFLMRSQLGSIRQAGPKIARLRQDLDALGRDVAAIKDLERRRQALVQKTGPANAKRVIQESEIPSLIQHISDLANRHHVKIALIKPSRDPKAKEEVVAGLRLLPVTISLSGRAAYHSLGRFVTDLENSAQFMSVQELRIESGKEDYQRHEVSLVIKTYVKK